VGLNDRKAARLVMKSGPHLPPGTRLIRNRAPASGTKPSGSTHLHVTPHISVLACKIDSHLETSNKIVRSNCEDFDIIREHLTFDIIE
jgi:hypothetical protein